ncbi:MAG: alpha/beta fold hydrolase [Chloroflexi bacterium]|nr:alpha/beta fold hydrolase [Chloroflexota bacterium]
MPTYTRDGDISIHFEEYGDPAGFPVVLFAPGLMRSSAGRWDRTDLVPRTVLGNGYRIIAMDQRNAGESKAPITATSSWADYADDAIGLIDHLGLERLAVWGRCIGPSFCMKVIQQLGHQAARVTALIDHAPIGLTAINRGHFMHGFYQWAEELPAGTFAEAAGMDPIAAAFCENLFGTDFVFSVSRSWVGSMQTPTLVLPGRDLAHPQAIALETADLAPNAELKMGWQDDLEAAGQSVRDFLSAHR